MATIQNPILKMTKSSDNKLWWQIEVIYKAVFTDQELAGKHTFRDAFALFEDDSSPNKDDHLASGGILDNSPFTATKKEIYRTLNWHVDENTLDTEIGLEELYAKVSLTNTTLNTTTTATTGGLKLTP